LVGLVWFQLRARRLGNRILGDDLSLSINPSRQAVNHGLWDIADDRQSAAHISVDRAIADGQFAFVAGSQEQVAEFV
jgi:hypothetical protein